MDFSFQKNGFLKGSTVKPISTGSVFQNSNLTPQERLDRMKFDRPLEKKPEKEIPSKPLDERLTQQRKMDVLRELGRKL